MSKHEIHDKDVQQLADELTVVMEEDVRLGFAERCGTNEAGQVLYGTTEAGQIRDDLACKADKLADLATALARRVVWALKFMDVKGAGLVMGRDERPQHWIDYFCDAVDQTGNLVDREALREIRAPKRRKALKVTKPPAVKP